MYFDKEQNWFVYYIKEDYESEYEEEAFEGEDYEEITYRLDLSPIDMIANDWKIVDEIF